MKILALCLLRRDPSPSTMLAAEYDVSSFSFFQRSSVQEFLGFFAATLSDKTTNGMRQAVEQDSTTHAQLFPSAY
jgi:synaptobrevin homolog YKT6